MALIGTYTLLSISLKFMKQLIIQIIKKPFSFIDQMVSCFKSEAFQTKLKIGWLAAHYLEDELSRFPLMLASRTSRPVQPIQHQSMHEFRA